LAPTNIDTTVVVGRRCWSHQYDMTEVVSMTLQ